MTTDITKIPQQDLLNDRAASLSDIKICELALLHDIQEYSKGGVQERLKINQGIVAVIDKELVRRKAIATNQSRPSCDTFENCDGPVAFCSMV